MTSINESSFDLDYIPFQFHLPEAKLLQKYLIKIYPNSKIIKKLLNSIKFDVSIIFWDQSVDLLWYEILNTSSRYGVVPNLIKEILNGSKPDFLSDEEYNRMISKINELQTIK